MFDQRTQDNLRDVDEVLIELCEYLDGHGVKFTVIEGFRTQERQDMLVKQGLTKVPHSKHTLGRAIDVIPQPFRQEDWKDTRRFYYLAGMFHVAAQALGIKLRWGGDWDGDGDFRDQQFDDLVHFELV